MELQNEYVQYQEELQSKEAELTQKILEKMQAILRRIGQTEDYTLIIEANEGGVVWVPSNLDLTDVLIQRYNKQAKEGQSPKKSK
jgi:outer membrane protein